MGGWGCAGARWGAVGSGVMIEGWQSVSVCVDTESGGGGGRMDMGFYVVHLVRVHICVRVNTSVLAAACKPGAGCSLH